MLIGYTRVSTFEQNDELQKDALIKAGCERTFSDKISGTVKERPQLERLKDVLRKGDTLVIWRLDRLGRSLKDLMEWMIYLEKSGVSLKSIHESIDTSTARKTYLSHFWRFI